MCGFWGRRKDFETVPALWELRLVVGVGGGRAWTETSQPAVEGSTYQTEVPAPAREKQRQLAHRVGFIPE